MALQCNSHPRLRLGHKLHWLAKNKKMQAINIYSYTYFSEGLRPPTFQKQPPPPILGNAPPPTISELWVRTMVTFWFFGKFTNCTYVIKALHYFVLFWILPSPSALLETPWWLNIEIGDSMLAIWTKMWQENVQCNVFIQSIKTSQPCSN